MADYWKSNPRHFCEFCKCWIADNKPSRDFHERGKNHQKNVQLKISEVRKKAVKDDKIKEEESSYFKQMEEAAKKAFLKDIKNDPKLAQQYLQKTQEKKKATANPQPKDSEPQGSEGGMSTVTGSKTRGEGSITEAEESKTEGMSGTWRLTESPEGYPYYWNDITGEVSWTLPEGAVFEEGGPDENIIEADDNTKGQTENKETTAKKQSDPENVESNTGEDIDSNETVDTETNSEAVHCVKEKPDIKEKEVKVSQADTSSEQNAQPFSQAADFDLGDISCIPLPGEIPVPVTIETSTPETESVSDQHDGKVDSEGASAETVQDDSEEASEGVSARSLKRGHDSAYGQWETVPEDTSEPIDLELPEVKQKAEEKVIVLSEPKLRFREKKVNTLGADLVAFKKRKMNSRNLKQRQDT